jgi:Ca2+-dependent lipid-binding protein
LKDETGLASTIIVSVDYIPIKKEIHTMESINNMGQLRVVVLDAPDLPSADRNGYSDPYCKFELDRQVVFKTKVQKTTLNPVWNEYFEIALRSRTAARFVSNLELLEPFISQEYKCSLDGKGGSTRLQLLFKPD